MAFVNQSHVGALVQQPWPVGQCRSIDPPSFGACATFGQSIELIAELIDEYPDALQVRTYGSAADSTFRVKQSVYIGISYLTRVFNRDIYVLAKHNIRGSYPKRVPRQKRQIRDQKKARAVIVHNPARRAPSASSNARQSFFSPIGMTLYHLLTNKAKSRRQHHAERSKEIGQTTST